VLTGGLTHKDRSGTLIDWNLCFNARGESSNRTFRSGTPAFMAPVLLEDTQIPRRTLAHDMESFFAVIIWIATLNYDDEAAFQAKPLAVLMLDKKMTPINIVNSKENWFKNPEGFQKWITDHFEPIYYEDMEFLKCLFKLREILYPTKFDLNTYLSRGLGKNDNKVTEDADLMKEDLFRQCMKELDGYLSETKGCDEMEQIGKWRAADGRVAEGTDGRAAEGTDGRAA
jgi:Fungal protein kinase